MKHCGKCDSNRPLSDFAKSNSRKDGLQNYCKGCMISYRKDHYESNKNQYQVRNKKTSSKLRDLVLCIKNQLPCADCGVRYPNEPWLFEFDHLRDKTNTISELTRKGSLKLLLQELEKCDMVCVLCHRRRTAIRGGWQLNRFVD